MKDTAFNDDVAAVRRGPVSFQCSATPSAVRRALARTGTRTRVAGRWGIAGTIAGWR